MEAFGRVPSSVCNTASEAKAPLGSSKHTDRYQGEKKGPHLHIPHTLTHNLSDWEKKTHLNIARHTHTHMHKTTICQHSHNKQQKSYTIVQILSRQSSGHYWHRQETARKDRP